MISKFSVRAVLGAILVTALAALLAALILMGGNAAPATADASIKTPISAVSSAQLAAIPALRGPVTAEVPQAAQRFASVPFISNNYAPNVALARAIRVPGAGDAAWAVIPGNNSVCLTSGDSGGGTCASLADAAAGKLYIQLITPPDAQHAVPGPGQSVESTIVGVAPTGTTAVTASAAAGPRLTGALAAGGLYTLSGTDITSVSLNGSGAPPVAISVR